LFEDLVQLHQEAVGVFEGESSGTFASVEEPGDTDLGMSVIKESNALNKESIIKQLQKSGGGAEVIQDNGVKHVLHQSTKKEGYWQV